MPRFSDSASHKKFQAYPKNDKASSKSNPNEKKKLSYNSTGGAKKYPQKTQE